MKRTLLLVAAITAVLALPATASAFRGVAVAKDQARHSVVVAAKGGVVRTVRAPGRLASIRLGHGVTYSARRLSDGTFRATSIHSTSLARHAVLRGVVVRNQRRLHRVLLTAGGTVLSVRAPARGFASNRGPRAGDRVEVRVSVSGSGLIATSLTTLGHSGTMELEGIFLSATADTLRLAVEHRGEVFVAIPAGFQLPQLQPGDEIELIVDVDAAGAFTLVSVQTDDENDGDHEGIGEDHGRVEVHGADHPARRRHDHGAVARRFAGDVRRAGRHRPVGLQGHRPGRDAVREGQRDAHPRPAQEGDDDDDGGDHGDG